MAYIQGFLVPVPRARKAEYVALAKASAPLFTDYGATRIVENWADDVPDGKVTDFRSAVKAAPDDAIVFSWIVWPDRETYETAERKMMDDPRMKDMPEMPFDGMKMTWAGFETVFDTDET